jgi:hypothetical protein
MAIKATGKYHFSCLGAGQSVLAETGAFIGGAPDYGRNSQECDD